MTDYSALIEKLKSREAEITALLKGPMSNIERAWLVADRIDIRQAIQRCLSPSADPVVGEP